MRQNLINELARQLVEGRKIMVINTSMKESTKTISGSL